MDFDERYRAIAARDARFDGQFFTAVHSTGIYCRPSCPARTPKPENVSFYLTSAAAHEAGFRACKRCLPEATPGTPAWNTRSDVAARAMRLILDGVVDREGITGLASRLGYSTRQLGRTLTQELGAGPLALARASRAHTARALLTQTTLSAADVAFASGFASIRQFNDTIQEIFATTPTALRESAHPATRSADTPGAIRLRLPVREPFDAAGIFAFIGARAVPGVERYVPATEADGPRYARALRLDHGLAFIDVTYTDAFYLTAHLSELSDLPAVIARVRRLFDLDADPSAVAAALSTDRHLRALVIATPGIRLPGALDAEEMIIRALVGQQISVKAARTWLSRLAQVGSPWSTGDEVTRVFPTARQLAERGRDILKGPAPRITAFTAILDQLASGELAISAADDAGELQEQLVALRGVGPWTAGYIAMRVLGAPDILPPGDVALRTGAERLGIDTPIERYAAAWSPWRSYASLHLWNAALPSAAPKTLRSKDLS